jgi:hypothetical protein
MNLAKIVSGGQTVAGRATVQEGLDLDLCINQCGTS